MTESEILSEREKIMSQIRQHVPAMGQLFDLRETLRDYSKSLYKFNADPVHLQRQVIVKEALDDKLSSVFGSNYQNALNVSFDGQLAFNIADHHQVLNHPFIISSNVIGNVEKFLQSNKPHAIVVISSGDVPPNNYFSENGFRLNNKKVALFSNSERESCSYLLPKREFDFVGRTKKAGWWHDFSSGEQAFLIELEKSMQSNDYSRCQNYCDQISIILRQTWPLMFAPDLRINLPELVYVTQEEITTKILVKLLQSDTFISRALFDSATRQAVLNNFRGIVVTWREDEAKGTHFFWRRHPGAPRALRMYLKGNYLVPHDQRFNHLAVELNQKTIIDMLESGEIFPSLFLIFSVLNFYCGVRPLVGFGSVQYLHLIKEAWVKTLSEIRDNDEAARVKTLYTSAFVAGLAIFFKREVGELRTQFAHDLMFNGGISEDYLNKVFDMQVHDVLSVGVADMYDYYKTKYIPESERISARINFDDLAEFNFAWV